jgi:probable rRNA maturation factor
MIEVNNLTVYSIDKKSLKKTAAEILKKESIRGRLKKKDLSIALVGQKRIKELNKRYRGKNRPTDVLAFEDGENWGEVIICPVEIKKNAKKFNSTFKKEVARVLIHGILHLFGYDHEKEEKEEKRMRKKEEYYLDKLYKI